MTLHSQTHNYLYAAIGNPGAFNQIKKILEAVSGAVAGAEITVGDEDANVREISIQLLDEAGQAIASRQSVEIAVFANASATAFAATGGSTGLAIDDAGVMVALVAKKLFRAISNATGSITLTWTDTQGEAAYLGIVLPNGKLVMSDALTTDDSSGA